MSHPRSLCEHGYLEGCPRGCQRDSELARLRAENTALRARINAIVGWLEREQPDVWQRGIWDAIDAARAAGTTSAGPP